MSKKDMTIVIVNDFDYVQGGASKVAIDTANLLYSKGHNVIFFSATHKENKYKYKQVTTDQAECLREKIRGSFRGISNRKVKKEFSKLLDTLDREKTIIHVHGWTKSLSSVIFKVAYKKQFKIVLTLHDYFTACPNGGFFNYKKNKICELKPMCGKCRRKHCDSRNYAFKLYRLIRQKVQNKNMKHLSNYIYISDFSYNVLKNHIDGNFYKLYNLIPITKEKRSKIEDNKTYVYVGRVSKEKGVDIFCEAMTNLKLKGVVVGDGGELNTLKAKYPKVKFVGWKSSKDVKKYLKKSKCMIFPSKLYEGAPLTIMEALSLGVPCIVSNKCAAADFVVDGENGLHYDGTESNLETKIKEYEQIKVDKMSKTAYKNYWKEPFDEKRYYKNLIKIYKDIMR